MKSVLGFLAALVLMTSAGCANAGFFDHPLIGKKAPDIKLNALSGGPVTLEQARAEGKAIYLFWATWCPHCREQLKAVSARKEEFATNGVKIVLINVGEDRNTVAKFIEAKKIDLTVLLDINSDASELYQVSGIPMVVLIGADGIVREAGHGLPDHYADLLK